MADANKLAVNRNRRYAEAAEDTLKRIRTSGAPTKKTFNEARIELWSENGRWPTVDKEAMTGPFRELVNHARARKRALSCNCPDSSLSLDVITTPTRGRISCDAEFAPYKHPMFELQLKEAGSSMVEHELGISAESRKLCQQLLNALQEVP
jgi:hypothetical protein